MALISAKTILTSLCLFHITLGFFFLTNPGTIADQAVVYLLGESMGLVCFVVSLFNSKVIAADKSIFSPTRALSKLSPRPSASLPSFSPSSE